MNWQNLRRNKCPKCNSDLVAHPLGTRFNCADSDCGFAISEERFSRLMAEMNKQAIERPQYQGSETVNDLRRDENPLCTFCRTYHPASEQCIGFGT